MQYVNYEEAIVQCYGVVLEGWTFDRFVNLSELSTALPPLQRLHDALDDGSCKFVKLTREQCKEHEKDYCMKLGSGEIQVRQRKTRKDAGQKQKRISSKGNDSDSDASTTGSQSDADDVHDKNLKRKKRRHSAISTPVIDDSNDED
jgi:hypothetical protein